MFFLGRQHGLTVPALTLVNVTISTNQVDFNLFNYLSGLGFDVSLALQINATIASGVQLTASSTSTYGYRSGAFVATSTIALINNGFIVGRGGAGGAGMRAFDFASGYPGGAGGGAMYIEHDHTLTNSGTIGGGGGGGGGGSDGQIVDLADEATTTAGGGGGGGAGYGSLGLGGAANGGIAGANGVAGTVSSGGAGGIGYGAGGTGGALGTAGNAGSGGSPTFSFGGAAGAAGAAIIKNGNTVTIAVTGTISGTVS